MQVSKEADFSTGLDLVGVLSGETIPFNDSGWYYWRVRGSSGVWSDSWLFNLDATGTAITTAGDDALPDRVRLFDNYPNPFNPTTTLMYELPEAMNVRLEVFDLLGRRVRVLDEGPRTSGAHSLTFDATGLSTGVYVYVLKAGGTRLTRKMILLR
jgi:hypothetical protein